jgi:hypothetical protein
MSGIASCAQNHSINNKIRRFPSGLKKKNLVFKNEDETPNKISNNFDKQLISFQGRYF